MDKDEDHVKRVVAGLKLWVPDMWKKDQSLVNICDGTIAFDEMARVVLMARKAGEDVCFITTNVDVTDTKRYKMIQNKMTQ